MFNVGNVVVGKVIDGCILRIHEILCGSSLVLPRSSLDLHSVIDTSNVRLKKLRVIERTLLSSLR